MLHLRRDDLPLCSTEMARHVRNSAGRSLVPVPFALTDDVTQCRCETCRLTLSLFVQDDAFVEMLKVLTERERRAYFLCKKEAEQWASAHPGGAAGVPDAALHRMQDAADRLEMSIRRWLHRIRTEPVLA